MKQYHYEEVNKPKKSAFDLSHEFKFTMKHGDLVPVLCQEVIPGDTFSLSQELLIRNMPLIAPMMHRVDVFTHFFYVPKRILWDGWKDFITGQGAEQSGTISVPAITGTFEEWETFLGSNELSKKLLDYFGVPVQQFTANQDTDFKISQLPFRAYVQIFNQYYRDQNLESEVNDYHDVNIDMDIAVPEFQQWLNIRSRNLEKDYFTSALPNTQYGEPVTLPLGEFAPVVGQQNVPVRMANNATMNNYALGGDVKMEVTNGSLQAQDNTFLTVKSGLIADLTNATAATINDIRRAFALQRYAELLMRGGRRIKEWTLNIFGVNIPDERIQIPEYLGGGKLGLQISEVIQTAPNVELEEGQGPLGTLAGHGVAGGQTTGFKKYFFEHGYIIGIMSILPKTGYFQGIPKNLIKFDKFDFYTPQFAHIGEQAILNKELCLLDDGNDDLTFGYTPRYAEYRDNHNRVAGEMRTTLKHWHLCKEYANRPELNDEFLKIDDINFTRVFAVQDSSDKFIVQTYFNITAIRPVAKFGNPI